MAASRSLASRGSDHLHLNTSRPGRSDEAGPSSDSRATTTVLSRHLTDTRGNPLRGLLSGFSVFRSRENPEAEESIGLRNLETTSAEVNSKDSSNRYITAASGSTSRLPLRLATKEDLMKFSHSLRFNAVPDWSSHYIAYSNLKKL